MGCSAKTSENKMVLKVNTTLYYGTDEIGPWETPDVLKEKYSLASTLI